MSQHPNARLTPRGRELLASRVAGGERVSAVARQMGVSRQTASKWLSRARRGEPLSDRPSRPRRLARSTPPEVEEAVCEARSSMLLPPLALAAVALGIGCLYAQDVGEAVVVRNFGGSLAGHTTEAGFHAKAPWQDVTSWDIRNRLINLYRAGVFDNQIWCLKELVHDFNEFRKINREPEEKD